MKVYTVFVLIGFLFLLNRCAPDSQRDMAQVEDPGSGSYQVAFLIMDGTYNTELTAPYDIFQHTQFRENIRPMHVFTVANTKKPVTTFEGIRILPDYDYTRDKLPQIDILVVPSAEHHLDADLEDEQMIRFVKAAADSAEYIMSLCDGAFVLARAGLLDQAASTTFPADIGKYRAMFPDLEVFEEVHFVHDGKFITSAGGAKSFDTALYLTEHLYGKAVAEEIAEGLVINWDVDLVPRIIRNRRN